MTEGALVGGRLALYHLRRCSMGDSPLSRPIVAQCSPLLEGAGLRAAGAAMKGGLSVGVAPAGAAAGVVGVGALVAEAVNGAETPARLGVKS
eukprot:2958624-Prymnesium_polylepis.2